MQQTATQGPSRLGLFKHSRRSAFSKLAILGILTLAFGVAACSENTLSELGRSSQWLEDAKPPPETTLVTTEPEIQTRSLASVGWWNLGIADPLGTTSEDIVQAAFDRQPGEEFIQSGPAEIVTVFPELLFPQEVADEIISITSQLVFARGTPTLGSRQVAAFGFWSAEPYTRSRSVAQRAVLEVLRSSETDMSCHAESAIVGELCAEETIGGREMFITEDSSGRTWSWIEAELGYRLFIRWPTQNGEIMLTTLQPLSDLLSSITVTSVGSSS